MELTDLWGAGTSEEQSDCKSQKPAVIGSIRHVVKASNISKKKSCVDLVVMFYTDTKWDWSIGTQV